MSVQRARLARTSWNGNSTWLERWLKSTMRLAAAAQEPHDAPDQEYEKRKTEADDDQELCNDECWIKSAMRIEHRGEHQPHTDGA